MIRQKTRDANATLVDTKAHEQDSSPAQVLWPFNPHGYTSANATPKRPAIMPTSQNRNVICVSDQPISSKW